MASIAGHGITLLSSCAGGVVQCNANELDLAIPSDCTMIFFLGWKGLLAFIILISVLDDAGGFDIWASLSSAILGLFSFVLCKAKGCGLPWVSSASWGRILVANHVLCYFYCCLLCIILVWKEVNFGDHNWPAAWPYFSHTIA
jgi:hypothetical protein